MPKKVHTEEQIVAVLQQGQAGEKVTDICRKVESVRGRTMHGRSNLPAGSFGSSRAFIGDASVQILPLPQNSSW